MLNDARGMRRLATGALVVCAAGMTVCRFWEEQIPWLGFFRAVFEAATIGALADWFAVVALFRHPLGLPIPHTAILPNNKARVAESLAGFIETSFLTEERLGPRIRGMDYAGMAARWLREHARDLAGRAAEFAPRVLEGLRNEEMSGLLADRAREMIRSAPLGPMAAAGLEAVTKDGRDREIFLHVMKSARQLLEEHRQTIQAKISEEIPLPSDLLRNLPLWNELLGRVLEDLRDRLAAAVAEKTIDKVRKVLREAEQEPDSALWKSFDSRLRKFLEDLQSSPEMAERLRTMQEAAAESGAVGEFAGQAWQRLKEFMLQDCAGEDSVVRRRIEEGLLAAAGQLEENSAVRSSLNEFLGGQVLAAALALRWQVREFVVSTIEGWDAREMSARLEETVGRDLQFIRLNGTVVGGLIGGAIYLVFRAFGI